MTTFGKIKEFNGDHQEWKHYIERMNHFFEANEIKDEGKQRSIFLVSVGAKMYKLIRSLVPPEEPKSKSYEQLAKLVQNHYQPKPSVIVERFKFNYPASKVLSYFFSAWHGEARETLQNLFINSFEHALLGC
jgi:hypothetical protein